LCGWQLKVSDRHVRLTDNQPCLGARVRCECVSM
jgi:hypothetical protein